jgi:hypothetical protein
MSRPARVLEVEHLGEYRLRLTFSDRLVSELDFDGILQGGVFEPLADTDFFGRVSVDEVAGTIAWPNGVDLAPDVLHGDHRAGQRSSSSRTPAVPPSTDDLSPRTAA